VAPKIPRNLRPDLEQVNSLLQGITEKLSNIGRMGEVKINLGEEKLVGSYARLEKINKAMAKNLAMRDKASTNSLLKQEALQEKIKKVKSRMLSIEGKLDDLGAKSVQKRKQLNTALNQGANTVVRLHRELDKVEKASRNIDNRWVVIGKTLKGQVLEAVDNIGKSILLWGVDSVFVGLDLIKRGFMAVYDLTERSVQATGEFNQNMGAGTKGLALLRAEGWKLEGAFRSLSKAGLGIGLKELEAVAKGFGFAKVGADGLLVDAELFNKAAEAGRALGIGSEQAGQLARSWKLTGGSAADLARSFTDIEDAANAAGVPVAQFTQEVAGSTDFMARFGAKGRKVFLEATSYAKNLGLSMKSLQSFTDLTDTFEGSANAASMLNAAFQTNISSLDLMLEKDPAARIEKVRQALIGQGIDTKNVSEIQLKLIAQTMSLSLEETQAVLQRGETLDGFRKKQKKASLTEVEAQRQLRSEMMKTAQTINNWGQTFDTMVRELMPLLRPVLEAFGFKFTKTLKGTSMSVGDFGKKIQGLVKNVTGLIQRLTNPGGANSFIKDVGADLKRVVDLFTGSGPESDKFWKTIGDGIQEAAKFADKFYRVFSSAFNWLVDAGGGGKLISVLSKVNDNIGLLLGAWTALKVMQIGQGITSLGGSMAVLGGAIGKAGLLGGVFALSYAMTKLARETFPQIDDAVQKWLDWEADKLSWVFGGASTKDKGPAKMSKEGLSNQAVMGFERLRSGDTSVSQKLLMDHQDEIRRRLGVSSEEFGRLMSTFPLKGAGFSPSVPSAPTVTPSAPAEVAPVAPVAPAEKPFQWRWKKGAPSTSDSGAQSTNIHITLEMDGDPLARKLVRLANARGT